MKKGAKIAIAIVAILVVLAGTVAALFFTGMFDYLKPTRKAWTSQVQKALDLDGVKITDYSDYLEDYKDIYKKAYTSKMNISAELSISELDKDVQKVINNSKLIYETSNNPEGKNSQVKVSLETDNTEVLQLDVVTNGSKVGIAAKDIYDKYLTVSLEDLENYIKQNTANTRQKTTSLTSSSTELTKLYENYSKLDAYELLYISKDDLKSIQKTLSKAFEDSIDKKCYTKKANVKVDVDGKDVKATGFYLTMSGEDVYKLIDGLTNTIKDDSTLNKIITDKTNMLLEAMGEEKVSSDDVKEMLTQAVKEFMSSANDESFKTDKKGIQIAVYSRLNNPVRLEVNLVEDMDKIYDTKTILSIEYAKKKTIYHLTIDESNSIEIVDEYEKNAKDEKKGTLTIKYRGVSVGTVDYEYINKKSESKLWLNANAPLLNLTGSIEISSKGNYKKEPVNVLFSLDVKYEKQSAKIKAEGTIDYTANVSIPTLSSDNSVDILQLDEKKQITLLDEILKKSSEVLPARLKLLGINIKAEDIYKPAAQTDTNKDIKSFSSIEKDTVLTATKATTDTALGGYNQIVEVGFKDNKVVAVRMCMEFKDEESAKAVVSALNISGGDTFKNYKISQDKNKVLLDTNLDTFLSEEKISANNLTKDILKTTFENQGYTVEIK